MSFKVKKIFLLSSYWQLVVNTHHGNNNNCHIARKSSIFLYKIQILFTIKFKRRLKTENKSKRPFQMEYFYWATITRRFSNTSSAVQKSKLHNKDGHNNIFVYKSFGKA